MKISRKLTLAALTCGLFLSAVPGMRAQQPDNSVQNKNQSTTADNQTNAKSDRMLAQQARKAIMADKDLSTYAHNVKVIALNGAVTLKGPVKSDDEKQKVASDVEAVAGPDKVTNQLTVKQ
jgi:hyperosmotically inducible protein